MKRRVRSLPTSNLLLFILSMSFIVAIEHFQEFSKKYTHDERNMKDDSYTYNYSDFNKHHNNELEEYYYIYNQLKPDCKSRFIKFVKIYYEKLNLKLCDEGLETEEDKLIYAILLQYFLCP